jgi:hypothetical protein
MHQYISSGKGYQKLVPSSEKDVYLIFITEPRFLAITFTWIISDYSENYEQAINNSKQRVQNAGF